MIARRDARAGREDAFGVEQRHAVLVGLGAEREAGVVVGRRVGGGNCGGGDQRRACERNASRQVRESRGKALHG